MIVSRTLSSTLRSIEESLRRRRNSKVLRKKRVISSRVLSLRQKRPIKC